MLWMPLSKSTGRWICEGSKLLKRSSRSLELPYWRRTLGLPSSHPSLRLNSEKEYTSGKPSRLSRLRFSDTTSLFTTHPSTLYPQLCAPPLSSTSTTQFTPCSSPTRGHLNHPRRKARVPGWPNPPFNNRCKSIAHSPSTKTLPALVLAPAPQLTRKTNVWCLTSTLSLPTIRLRGHALIPRAHRST